MIETKLSPGIQVVTLDGENKTTFDNAWTYFHVKNIGDSDALISTSISLEMLEAPSAESPTDVVVVSSGASMAIPGHNDATILTLGNVQIIADNNPCSPFDEAQGENLGSSGRYYIMDGLTYPNGWTCETAGNCYLRNDWLEIFSGGSATLKGSFPKKKEKIVLMITADDWAQGPLQMEVSSPTLGTFEFSQDITDAIASRAVLFNFMIPPALIGQKDITINLSGAFGIYIFRAYLE